MERADRKRALDGGTSAATSSPPPPRKQAKVTMAINVRDSGNVSDEIGPVEEEEHAGSGGSLRIFQRAQLAAKIGELTREVMWARGKIAEMESVVAVLDAAPMQAGYFIAAANEDLSVCLNEVGGTRDESAGVASSVLETEVSVAALGTEVEELKRLSKAIVNAVRKNPSLGSGIAADPAPVSTNPESEPEAADRAEPVKDLHARMRVVSDQLERFEARSRESTLAADNLRDEMDDVRMLLDIRRRKIVALELAIREGREPPDLSIQSAVENAVGREVGRENGGATGPGRGSDSAGGCAGDSASAGEKSGHVGDKQGGGGKGGRGGGNVVERLASLQKLADSRLEELQGMVEEKKSLALEVLSLKKEVESRKIGILPESDITASAIYKAMEVNLLQISKQKVALEEEEKTVVGERAKERSEAEAKLEAVKSDAEKEAVDSRKLVDDLRRVAESAKAEKDKWAMTYEARKMEANASAGLVEACERRASVCEGMRDKLKKSNADVTKEVEDLRNRVREAELRAVGGADAESLPDAKELASRLEADLRAEREKCAAFIEEIESLSVMFGDLELENARLVKLLAEKDSVLSKVMGEKLRCRQQLATVKEEARSLTQGREFDQEKIKNIGVQVSASKRAVQESMTAASRSADEVRLLTQQLAWCKKLLLEASAAHQKASSSLEQLQKEHAIVVDLSKVAAGKCETSSFDVRRLGEENERLKAQLTEEERRRKEAEAAVKTAPSANSGKESLRDEIIQELMKKLHCSVCPNQPKEVALVRCGHMLSHQCVDQLVAQRSRKCPLCGLAFSASDVLNVFLD